MAKTVEEKKADAEVKIQDYIQKMHGLMAKATELADKYDIEFTYMPHYLGTYQPRELLWAASSSCEWETSDEWSEARWTHENFDWDSSTC